jgi:hypothetical protein
MRYRDTGDYQNPDRYLNSGAPVDDNLMFSSIILGIIIGIGFIAFGLRVKRYWMVIWGTGLIFAALSYFVMRMLGYF